MNIHRFILRGVATVLILLVITAPGHSNAGSPVGRDFIIQGGEPDQISPAAAYNPVQNEYMVAWTNDRPGNDDIYARRLSANGSQIGEWFSIVAGSGFERRNPDIGFNSAREEFLVVWEEEPSGGFLRIHGIRISKSGQLIPPVIEISTGPALNNCQNPSVAYASTSDTFLVVWESMVFGGVHSNIEGQLISSNGIPQDSNFPLSEAISGSNAFSDGNPDLTYNLSRNEFLAVFERAYDSTSVQDIYGRLVTGDGTPLGTSADVISGTADDKLNPAVAAIPSVPHEGKYLVAWESQYSAGNINIYGKRFKHDLSGDGIILMLSASSKSDSSPAVAADEHTEQFLVAWSQPSDLLVTRQIFAQYISQVNDDLGDDMPIGSTQESLLALEPAVASGLPGDFLVAFSDTRAGSPDSNIFGQLLGIRQYIPLIMH